MVYRSSSFQSTKEYGAALARFILERGPRSKGAVVIALSGNLGAGKTTFMQGFLKACGVRKGGTSPTFILVHAYRLKKMPFVGLQHCDLYRIKSVKELKQLGFYEIINNEDNIVCIEWPERIKKYLPKSTIWIDMKHVGNSHERTLRFRGVPTASLRVLA